MLSAVSANKYPPDQLHVSGEVVCQADDLGTRLQTRRQDGSVPDRAVWDHPDER